MPNNEFKTKTIKTFPKLNIEGVDVIATIEEDTISKAQYYVLKVVGVDETGFPRGPVKTKWFSMKHSKALFEYSLNNLTGKK